MAFNSPRRATFGLPQTTLDLMKKIDGTAQQERFWEFLVHGSSHGILEARAGSGKTFSIVQGILRVPPSVRVRVFSFNKHIMTALQNQLKAAGIFWASAQTYHSFGLSVLRRNFNCEVEQSKVLILLKAYSQEANKLARLAGKQYSAHVQAIADVISALKNCYMEATPENVAWIMGRFDIDCERDPEWIADVCKEILERNNRVTSMVDFNDMIYMPIKLDLNIPGSDLVMVDEVQDTSPVQQELALRAGAYGRVVVVGDDRQSIYGFRGADTDAIPRLKRALTNTDLGCETYPLTVTRRCPKSHVEIAQGIVPDIEAMDEAPDGHIMGIEDMSPSDLANPGDMLLCRTNAPLIPACYTILSRGIPAKVQGLDLSKGLITLIKKLDAESIPDLTIQLEDYYEHQVNLEQERAKEREEKGEFYNTRKANMKLSNIRDKVDCIIALAAQQSTVNGLLDSIQSMFSDEQSNTGDKVILGTIHRTKGLEAGKIIVLAPELIPHPLAEADWEREQEKNIAYIAATRAKWGKDGDGYLMWAGQQPRIYRRMEVEDL